MINEAQFGRTPTGQSIELLHNAQKHLGWSQKVPVPGVFLSFNAACIHRDEMTAEEKKRWRIVKRLISAFKWEIFVWILVPVKEK